MLYAFLLRLRHFFIILFAPMVLLAANAHADFFLLKLKTPPFPPAKLFKHNMSYTKSSLSNVLNLPCSPSCIKIKNPEIIHRVLFPILISNLFFNSQTFHLLNHILFEMLLLYHFVPNLYVSFA